MVILSVSIKLKIRAKARSEHLNMGHLLIQQMEMPGRLQFCIWNFKTYENDIERLNCHTTHCVRLKHVDYDENDGLYVIYDSQAGQEATFMCDWLHYFVTVVYWSHFKRVGSSYLATKGLDIDSWVDYIKDGKWPNFFTLFALNILLETHTMVHINGGRIWATMDKAPCDHQQLSKMCDYHLVFLGCGCFAELVERQHPLILVEPTNRDVKVLELGTLMMKRKL